MIITFRNKPVNEGIKEYLKDVLLHDYSKSIMEGILWNTKNHFSTRFPSSNHYNPDKVSEDRKGNNEASINIDVPGITRAYHSIDIYPIKAKVLTIPIHSSAYGLKVREYPLKLFRPKGKDVLATVKNGQLVSIYALSRHVHQAQDSSLMPSDEAFSLNIFSRITSDIEYSLAKNSNM